MSKRLSASIENLLWLIPLLPVAIWVGVGAASIPVSFDGAFNLQVVKSLATTFTYATTYQPAVVYNPEITTNGPMQYFGALVYFATHSIDTVVLVSAVVGIGLLVLSAYLIRPWLTILVAALLLVWPIFFYTSAEFVGEVWGASFVLFGIVCMERIPNIKTVGGLVRNRYFIYGCVLLAAAVATKLILMVAAVCAIIAVAYARATQKKEDAFPGMLLNSLAFISVALVTVTALFVVQFAVSYIHSTAPHFAVSAMSVALLHFLIGHAGQAKTSLEQASISAQIGNFSSPIILVVLALSTAALLLDNPGFAPMILLISALWLRYGLWEKRMLPFFLILILLGARAAANRLAVPTSRLARILGAHRVFKSSIPIAAALLLILGNRATGREIATPGTLKSAPGIGKLAYTDPFSNARTLFVETSLGEFQYDPQLVQILKRQRYVVTSGWNQFPEISVRWNLEFYDRMAPESAMLPRSSVALLFDASNPHWPTTSQDANCRSIIYKDGPLVLCAVRTDVPLNAVTYSPPLGL